MGAFVLAASVLSLLAAAAILYGPRRQRPRAGGASQQRTNAVVLRQQLAQAEAEHARGLIDARELAALRDELHRRLLAEATAEPSAAGQVARPRRALFACAVAVPLLALPLYLHFGHPQLLRLPATAADPAATGDGDMVSRLQVHLAAAPEDARAWVMLARAHMQRDQFEPAARAYQRALDASAKVARDPLIWCEYADALGMAAGGRLAGRPRELIDRALALDAAHPRALEMAGSAAYEAGDFRGAARYWQQLLARLPADSAEHAQLAAAVARAERQAKFSLPSS